MTLAVVVAMGMHFQTPILVTAMNHMAMEASVAVGTGIWMSRLLQIPSEVVGIGMPRFLQIPSVVAAVLVAAEGIEVGIGMQMLQGMLPQVKLTDHHAAASISWTLLSSYHLYLVASNEYKYTIFVLLIHYHHILHCIMLVNHV